MTSIRYSELLSPKLSVEQRILILKQINKEKDQQKILENEIKSLSNLLGQFDLYQRLQNQYGLSVRNSTTDKVREIHEAKPMNAAISIDLTIQDRDIRYRLNKPLKILINNLLKSNGRDAEESLAKIQAIIDQKTNKKRIQKASIWVPQLIDPSKNYFVTSQKLIVELFSAIDSFLKTEDIEISPGRLEKSVELNQLFQNWHDEFIEFPQYGAGDEMTQRVIFTPPSEWQNDWRQKKNNFEVYLYYQELKNLDIELPQSMTKLIEDNAFIYVPAVLKEKLNTREISPQLSSKLSSFIDKHPSIIEVTDDPQHYKLIFNQQCAKKLSKIISMHFLSNMKELSNALNQLINYPVSTLINNLNPATNEPKAITFRKNLALLEILCAIEATKKDKKCKHFIVYNSKIQLKADSQRALQNLVFQALNLRKKMNSIIVNKLGNSVKTLLEASKNNRNRMISPGGALKALDILKEKMPESILIKEMIEDIEDAYFDCSSFPNIHL